MGLKQILVKLTFFTLKVVFTPHLISKNYIRSWFIIDLFAAIPVDLFTIFLEFPKSSTWQNSSIRGSLNNVQMLKILRLLRLARVAYKLELLTQYGAVALTVSGNFYKNRQKWTGSMKVKIRKLFEFFIKISSYFWNDGALASLFLVSDWLQRTECSRRWK